MIQRLVIGTVMAATVAATLTGCGDGSKPAPIAAAPVTVTSPTALVTTAPTPKASPSSAPPAEVKAPNVVGQNAAVAQDTLQRLGFTKIQFGSSDPDHRIVLLPSNWTVRKQSAKAGKAVSTDALIVLTCTKD